MAEFFTAAAEPIRYAGPDSDDPLTFRWHDTDRVGERSMAEHLRQAAAATASSLAATPAGTAAGATTDG